MLNNQFANTCVTTTEKLEKPAVKNILSFFGLSKYLIFKIGGIGIIGVIGVNEVIGVNGVNGVIGAIGVIVLINFMNSGIL